MIDPTTYDWVARHRFLIASLVAVYASCEIVWFYLRARRAQPAGQIACNVSIFVVNATVRKVTYVVRLAIFGAAYALSPLRIPTNIWTACACYVAVDFFLYWLHRWLHETKLGWAVHSVHHSGREFELSLGVRTSWVLGLVDDFFYLPLTLLGFHPLLVLGMIALNRFGQFFAHTEMVGHLGILDRLFNTPSNHRVHHANREGGSRHNYGSSFMVWDHLFGTYAPELERGPFGIEGADPGNNPLRVQFDGLVQYFEGWGLPGEPGFDRALRVGFSLFFLWWLGSYLWYFGAPVMLWLCSLANVYLVVGLWRRQALWFSMAAVAVAPIQLAYAVALAVRCLAGHRGTGGPVEYIFDPMIPLAIRLTSLYHVVGPALIAFGLIRFGYDRRAFPIQTGLTLVVLATCFLALAPPTVSHGTDHGTGAVRTDLAADRAANINWVYGFPAAPRPGSPWQHFLWLCVAAPLLVHWPTHRVLTAWEARPARWANHSASSQVARRSQ